jgi:putative flippase GtrA
MEAARQLAYRLHLPTTFVKFLIVGGIGFVVNTFVLYLLYDSPLAGLLLPDKDTNADIGLFVHDDIRLLVASVVAVECAIITQFNFHDRWTFRKRSHSGWIGARFAKFNLSSIVSPIIVVVTVNVLTPVIRDAAGDDSLIGKVAPYLANTAGVLLGFTWNWTLNSLVIWRDTTPDPETP